MLLTAKSLFTTFEFIMVVFVLMMIFVWIVANIVNGMMARRKRYIDEFNRNLKSIEPFKTTVSNMDNTMYKN